MIYILFALVVNWISIPFKLKPNLVIVAFSNSNLVKFKQNFCFCSLWFHVYDQILKCIILDKNSEQMDEQMLLFQAKNTAKPIVTSSLRCNISHDSLQQLVYLWESFNSYFHNVKTYRIFQANLISATGEKSDP